MPKIELHTFVKANMNLVFDLSRSVDLHKISTAQTHEDAIGRITKGLLKLNQSVTWRAKHLGFYQTLSSKITEFDQPNYFVDEMQKGIFKSFRHQHVFRREKLGTEMIDIFEYTSPFGILGKLADKLFLEKYMTNLLKQRNEIIKNYAESEDWRLVLD